MSLFPSARSALQVRVLPRIPAGVDADGGISASVVNGRLKIGFNYASLTPSIAPAGTISVAVLNSTTGQYELVNVSSLVGAALASANIGIDVPGIASSPIAAFQTVGLTNPGQFAPANSTATWLGKVGGLALGPAVLGGAVVVRTAGPVTNPAWNWTTAGRVFLAADGSITTTPPATGFVQEMGRILNATTIVVALQAPCRRGDIPGGGGYSSVSMAQFLAAVRNSGGGRDLGAIPIPADPNSDIAISARNGRVTQGNAFANLVQTTYGMSPTDMANIFTAAATIASV